MRRSWPCRARSSRHSRRLGNPIIVWRSRLALAELRQLGVGWELEHFVPGWIMLGWLHQAANNLLRPIPLRHRRKVVLSADEHQPLRAWQQRLHAVAPHRIAVEPAIVLLHEAIGCDEQLNGIFFE